MMILCKVHFRRGVYFIFRSQQKNLSGEHPVKVQEKPIKQIGIYVHAFMWVRSSPKKISTN